MSAAGLQLRGVTKAYGATRALDGVDLDVAPGEVLGIAGPNGAGKSTLVRIIGGEEQPDNGSAEFGGSPLEPAGTVAIVHQEAQLFPNLSVEQNLLVGHERRRVMRPRPSREDRELLDHLNLSRLRTRRIETCSLAAQQRVEIARALTRDSRIFLFDEPNSALTEEESAELFREMHRLAARGAVVLLVSHRLGDLVRHCGRVAIVRNGKVREEFSGAALSEEAIARALVVDVESATADERNSAAAAAADEVVLAVSDWTASDDSFAAIELKLRAGSVTALTGVEGSGARELLRSLAGLVPAAGGYELDGTAAKPGPGIAYVPASRRDSLFDNLDVGENLAVRQSEEITSGSFVLCKRRIRSLAKEDVRRFAIKVKSSFQAIRALSGGNQQKVAIAAAIAAKPRVLLLEEPTRGVDLGSRQEIYRLLRGLAQTGCAVLIFCTETTEVFDAATRVHVVSRGRLLPEIVVNHQHVEALAAELTRLELAAPTAATAARPASKEGSAE